MMLVNLLAEHSAPELVSPATLAPAGAGAQFQFTVRVDDVDALCTQLTQKGTELLKARSTGPGVCGQPAFATRTATSGRSRHSVEPRRCPNLGRGCVFE
jgi:hypothetical protein